MQEVGLIASVGCIRLPARERARVCRPFDRETDEKGGGHEGTPRSECSKGTHIHDPREHIVGADGDVAFHLEHVFGGDCHGLIRVFVTFQSVTGKFRSKGRKDNSATYSRRICPIMYCSINFLLEDAADPWPCRPATSRSEFTIWL